MFWILIVFIIVLTFNLFLQPLERIPSEVFSYVWSIVVIVKLVDLAYIFIRKRKIKMFKTIDPLLIGMLIGAIIVSIDLLPINGELLRDLFFGLSPLFLFINKVNDQVEDFQIDEA